MRQTKWLLPKNWGFCPRAVILLVCASAQLVNGEPGQELAGRRRTAFCIPVSRPPTIDGVLEDACWKRAVPESDFFRLESFSFARERTEILCVFDKTAMYIGAKAYSGNVDAIRAIEKRRDRGVWQDDSIELFLVPPEHPFFHFIVNSLGTLYDSRSDMKAAAWNPTLQVATRKVRGSGRKGYWTVEMAIPWKELGIAPRKGQAWKANFNRTDTNTGELSTWSVIEKGGFEQPGLFGSMIFRAPTRQELSKKREWLNTLRDPADKEREKAIHAIPLKPGEWTVLKKLRVLDCRRLRAFIGEPVDGCTRSKGCSGGVSEYPSPYVGAGIHYSFNNNDGLHISLEQGEGFDAVVLRGGAETQMVSDASSITGPRTGKEIWRFRGRDEYEAAIFQRRIKSHRISFFNARNGVIADLAFYRISRAKNIPEMESWAPRPEVVSLPAPATKYAPESIYLAMREFYAMNQRTAFLLKPGASSKPLTLPKGKAVHLLSTPLRDERGWAAVALEAVADARNLPVHLEVTAHDPLNPRRDIAFLCLAAGAKKTGSSGRTSINVFLDIPDQVIFKGRRIWLTLRSDVEVKLTGPHGGAPRIYLQFVPRRKALPEALAWRKFLMHTLFGPLSEPRPWGHFKKRVSREQFYALYTYSAQCPELFMTIDQCTRLDPSDDLTRQYREWVYLRHLDKLSPIDLPPRPPEGVPDWAWYPRLAWLNIR